MTLVKFAILSKDHCDDFGKICFPEYLFYQSHSKVIFMNYLEDEKDPIPDLL